jgi:hypothetical protein
LPEESIALREKWKEKRMLFQSALLKAFWKTAWKSDPALGCAPGGGQADWFVLTVAAGLSKDESHGQASLS